MHDGKLIKRRNACVPFRQRTYYCLKKTDEYLSSILFSILLMDFIFSKQN
jgi:hypothetical protein